MRCFHNFNRALLSKWLWHFANERGSLWTKFINLKSVEDLGGCCSCMVRGSFGTGIWKELEKSGYPFSLILYAL